METVVAIIPAAGSGKRMKKGMNKQFLEIGGQTVLARTLLAFENAKCISEVVVVTRAEEIEQINGLIIENNIRKIRCVVEGGKERQDSIFEGLKQTKESDKWVLVHDGARPFITSDQIDAFIEELMLSKALIMAVPSKDTIKKVDSGVVQETLMRSELWNVQTPQGFMRSEILKAYTLAKKDNYTGTDDASLVEWAGGIVKVFMGSYENIKVTTPDDLFIGEAILKMRGEI